MLVWLTLPFYDFCGFRSVAVNSVYKLQFFLHLLAYRTTHNGYGCVSHLQVARRQPPQSRRTTRVAGDGRPV